MFDVRLIEGEGGGHLHVRGFVPEVGGEAGEGEAGVSVVDRGGDGVEPLRAGGDEFADEGIAIVEVSVQGASREPGAARDDVDGGVRV